MGHRIREARDPPKRIVTRSPIFQHIYFGTFYGL